MNPLTFHRLKCTCSNTPNGECAKTDNIYIPTEVYDCDFDESDCNSTVIYSNPSQQNIGLMQSSKTLSTQLGYDLTDVTSISLIILCFPKNIKIVKSKNY